MGNICGCDKFSKKVGMLPPVPTMNPSQSLNYLSTQNALFDIDPASALVGGLAVSLVFVLFFWKKG